MHAECVRPYSGTSTPTPKPSINSRSCTHLHGERWWASNGNSVPLILFKRAWKVPHVFWTPRRHENSFNLVLCLPSLFELVLPCFFVVCVLPGAVMSAACVGVRYCRYTEKWEQQKTPTVTQATNWSIHAAAGPVVCKTLRIVNK